MPASDTFISIKPRSYGRIESLSTLVRDRAQSWQWRNLDRAVLIREIDLGAHGGSDLFVCDINNDGKLELLWLQSAGIFKSDLFKNNEKFPERSSPDYHQDLFCLTATDTYGNVLWQLGQPHGGSNPGFISHASDRMVDFGDIDDDGQVEVLVLDGSNSLLVCEGLTGRIRKEIELPADNFCTVKCSTSLSPQDVRVLVGNSDAGYFPHEYANPWIFFDRNFEQIHEGDYLGAGHDALVVPEGLDHSGMFLIGYNLVDRNGKTLWTLDFFNDEPIVDHVQQHVDATTIVSESSKWKVGFAGSDRLYLSDSTGRCEWSKALPHPQFLVLLDNSKGKQLVVFNQRHSMDSFAMNGDHLWSKRFPDHWPLGRPHSAFNTRPIHMNNPASVINISEDASCILYNEGGWPYVLDDAGDPTILFPPPRDARSQDSRTGLRRLNDYGLAFNAISVDLDGDGVEEVIIYNRSRAWIYSI